MKYWYHGDCALNDNEFNSKRMTQTDVIPTDLQSDCITSQGPFFLEATIYSCSDVSNDLNISILKVWPTVSSTFAFL